MSLSIRATLFLGFQVSDEDFVVSELSSIETCAEGHVKPGIDSFCPKDGGKFMRRPVSKPTKALLVLVGYHGVPFNEEQPAGDTLRALFDDSGKPSPIVTFENRSDTHMVVGIGIGGMSCYYSQNMSTIDPHVLAVAEHKVKELRTMLNMEERSILLYHYIRASS